MDDLSKSYTNFFMNFSRVSIRNSPRHSTKKWSIESFRKLHDFFSKSSMDSGRKNFQDFFRNTSRNSFKKSFTDSLWNPPGIPLVNHLADFQESILQKFILLHASLLKLSLYGSNNSFQFLRNFYINFSRVWFSNSSSKVNLL